MIECVSLEERKWRDAEIIRSVGFVNTRLSIRNSNDRNATTRSATRHHCGEAWLASRWQKRVRKQTPAALGCRGANDAGRVRAHDLSSRGHSPKLQFPRERGCPKRPNTVHLYIATRKFLFLADGASPWTRALPATRGPGGRHDDARKDVRDGFFTTSAPGAP